MRNSQTFIFIHGAWHASWCWEYIANALSLKGHTILTPDLPGHGRHTHTKNPISLQDYVHDVITLIKKQPKPITLVGHSMAGLIISHVAEIIPEAIRELVYIAAYIPQGSQSLLSIAEGSESANLVPFLIIDETVQEIRLNMTNELASIFF